MLVSEMSKNPENLIREGPIIVISGEGDKRECYLYLFISVLVIAEVLGDKFKYFHSYFPLSGASFSFSWC